MKLKDLNTKNCIFCNNYLIQEDDERFDCDSCKIVYYTSFLDVYSISINAFNINIDLSDDEKFIDIRNFNNYDFIYNKVYSNAEFDELDASHITSIIENLIFK